MASLDPLRLDAQGGWAEVQHWLMVVFQARGSSSAGVMTKEEYLPTHSHRTIVVA